MAEVASVAPTLQESGLTLLAGYYVLRPLRDQMGVAGGIKALPWVFTATFVTLLVAQPLYGALVVFSRLNQAQWPSGSWIRV
jgi:hypothetical protein